MNIPASTLKRYIPLLQQYIGLPFPEPELEVAAAERGDNPDAICEIRGVEHVSHSTITMLLRKHLDQPEKPSDISYFLWLAANLYYCGNISANEDSLLNSVINQYEEKWIQEEIAQLYSFIQRRKDIARNGDKEFHSITFVSGDKQTKLTIHNTYCWFEALLENYLFPNCLPDVTSDEDAKKIWEKEKQQPGPKAQKDKNAIIHGVEMFLHDYGVVTNAEAPKNLCTFLYYYLDAMNLQKVSNNPEEEDKLIWGIKSAIHNFRKDEDNAKFSNAGFNIVSMEELSITTPEQAAYDWLFNPKQDKKDDEKKEDAKEENVEIVEKKSIRLLLSKVRDIFRIGVYKKEKQEDTSHS